jgi:uncharacterized protein (DUF2141 family)
MKAGARHLTMSVLLIALASAAQAQTSDSNASAKGKVIGPTDQPQAGVPVTIEGPLGKTVAITDKSGTWSIYKLPAGEYKVKAFSDNSAPVTFTVKETPFWNKVMGGKDAAVYSPDIKVGPPQF